MKRFKKTKNTTLYVQSAFYDYKWENTTKQLDRYSTFNIDLQTHCSIKNGNHLVVSHYTKHPNRAAELNLAVQL